METVGWVSWIIIGGLVGWLASIFMRTRHGLMTDILVGLVGALIAGYLLNQLGTSGVTGFNLWSLLVAFIGAVILLVLIRVVDKNRPVAQRDAHSLPDSDV